MLSNQILQSTIEGLKNITRREIFVTERDGKTCAGTDAPPDLSDTVVQFLSSPAESQLVAGYQLFKVYDNQIAEYVICVKGEDEETYRIGKLAAFHLQSLFAAYKERFDRDNFIKNLLLDNLLLVDIHSRAKKLRIDNSLRRACVLIEAEGALELGLPEMVRNLFPSKLKDFVTSVDETGVILIKELKDGDDIQTLEKIARMICDTLTSECMRSVYVAIGTIVSDLKQVSASYKEAKMAMEVGRIFEPERYVINYERLGLGRLIYQLPMPLCRMFLQEVLHGVDMERFDEESLSTVYKFFENNLNVSETSRQLYIHRNTLVYRLDKLQKITGLDLRNFDDAITFKIMLMVSKYMKHKQTSE